jgi:hypothetical protein
MLDALLRTLGLVRKELLAILKDPRSRIALIGPPILQCLIFGYAGNLRRQPRAVRRARPGSLRRFPHLAGQARRLRRVRSRGRPATSKRHGGLQLVRAILAKHIIAAAKGGERDYGRLRDGVRRQVTVIAGSGLL